MVATRKSPLSCVTIGVASCALLTCAVPASAEQLSTYGTPGLIEMPTARSLNDGEIAFNVSSFGANLRQTVTFQVLPWVSGSFRYAIIEDFDRGGRRNRYDRSFDVHFQVLDESEYLPSLAVGLRDFAGTGIYSSEYVVATKQLTPALEVTGGIGWGRLAGRNATDSPLGFIADGFNNRVAADSGEITDTGQLDFETWFRGDISPFVGLSYDITDQLTVSAEYSPDLYVRESSRGALDNESPYNFGLRYRFENGFSLSAYTIGDAEVGAQLSYTFDPAKRPIPGSLGNAPRPLLERDFVAAQSWNLSGDPDQIRRRLARALTSEGMAIQGFAMTDNRVSIQIRNDRWLTAAQASGRAARVLANTMPPNIDVFSVTLQEYGVPITTIETRRSDLEELQFDYDGSWRTYARANIQDAADVDRSAELDNAFPAFGYSISRYVAFSLFDPDSPVRADIGPQLEAVFRVAPGVTFAGRLRYPIAGNIADATRVSNSRIQRVRTDIVKYAKQSDLEVNNLTAEYMFRPGPDLFGRVTVGYLEDMYGGVSGEVLWYPTESRLALGAELNYARQRDFDMLFGFQDYDVLTGHASAYYDLGNGFATQLDVGRYLAGDWGGTFSLDREFNNGFKVGGYFTLTDVSFEDFGEGSFDKGIRFEVPLSWITGQPSRERLNQTIQPILRDGGARLKVNNRLHSVVRNYRGAEIADSWGRYLR